MKFKDWWKSIPYWSKGGILAVVIYLIFLLLWTFPLIIFGGEGLEAAFYIIVFTHPLTYLGFFDGTASELIFRAIISYFIIGSLIGLIIGKIKSKKQ